MPRSINDVKLPDWRTLPPRQRAVVFGTLTGSALAATLVTIRSLTQTPALLGLDLRAYVEGARRLVETGSPYAPALHGGPVEHISENIPIAYFYPPPLAQLFVPLSAVPYGALSIAWALVQLILLPALLLLVFRRHGGVLTIRTATCILLAAIAFPPLQAGIYLGNVSGWVAIAVALALIAGGRGRGAASAIAAWLKVTPGALAVGALFDPSSRRATLLALVAIPAVSFALAPQAWFDWLAVLPNLLGTPAGDTHFNYAPSYVLSRSGLDPLGRVAPLFLGAGFLALAIANARQGWVAAWTAAAVGVYLAGTSTVWNHYFIVLVPIAVAVWPAASNRVRALIVIGLLWSGPLSIAAEHPWHNLVGLVLWVAFLASVSVGPLIGSRVHATGVRYDPELTADGHGRVLG